MPPRATPRIQDNELPRAQLPAVTIVYFPPGAAWTQLSGEPTDLHARMLFHMSQGPARTLAKSAHAWKERFGMKKRKRGMPPAYVNDVAGDWEHAATEWRWRERCARFDVYTIQQVVPEIAGIIFECVKLYALRVHEVLSDPGIRPEGWQEASEAVEALTRFISPESIALAALHHSANTGIESNSQSGAGHELDSAVGAADPTE